MQCRERSECAISDYFSLSKDFGSTHIYRRFLATTGEKGFVIDRAKAEEDARFDGIFVLRTNTDLAPLEVMLCYKQLTMVEQIFRTAKKRRRFAMDASPTRQPIQHAVNAAMRQLPLAKRRELSLMGQSRPSHSAPVPINVRFAPKATVSHLGTG